jgi:hypothetical protein
MNEITTHFTVKLDSATYDVEVAEAIAAKFPRYRSGVVSQEFLEDVVRVLGCFDGRQADASRDSIAHWELNNELELTGNCSEEEEEEGVF